MFKKVLLLISILNLNACENTEGQYRHDKKHHDQQAVGWNSDSVFRHQQM